jgi:fructose-bisphosphate aldolase class II
MKVIEEIHARLPNTHLVMHGSSSVPQELQDIINAYGGQMKPTWGVPVEEIQRGIKHGVRKINIDTDNRMAMTGQIRKVFAENPGEFDPRKYLKPAMDAMSRLCRQRLQEFNTAGQASKIRRVFTLAEMARRYAKGELDPVASAAKAA